MMYTDTSAQQLSHSRDLRQLLVRSYRVSHSVQYVSQQLTLQPSQRPLPSDMHLALLLGVAQVHILQIPRVLLTPLLAKDKVDDGQQLVLLEMIDKMCPDVLIEGKVST